jgi:hypothetical protein
VFEKRDGRIKRKRGRNRKERRKDKNERAKQNDMGYPGPGLRRGTRRPESYFHFANTTGFELFRHAARSLDHKQRRNEKCV